MAINTYLSIITLNINGLDAPVKRQSESREDQGCTFLSDILGKDAVGVNERENWKSLHEKIRCPSKFSEMKQFQTDRTQSMSSE